MPSVQRIVRPWCLPVCAAALAVAPSACGADVDVGATMKVVNVVTGYYDMGVVGGKNKLVPSISFQVQNGAPASVSNVQLNAVFRVVGDQQELGSALVRGIGTDGLTAGATSQFYVLRSSLGYTGEQPRAQMLTHKDFKDVQVEVFAKHGGKQWVKLAQHKVDRQLLTQ